MTFYDPYESGFYAGCVENLLTDRELAAHLRHGVVEIGVGTGLPVVDALRRSGSRVRVHGLERDPAAYRDAAEVVATAGVASYTVAQGDFFVDGVRGPARCAIGNPPYLPARVGAIGAPHLWGGPDGSDVAKDVLAAGFEVVLLMIASISDPVALVEHGRGLGYGVVDWQARPIPFGTACRDPRVSDRIAELARGGRAHLTPDSYVLAGVTWVRDAAVDRSADLVRIMTAAGSARSVGTRQSAVHAHLETTGGLDDRSAA